jgi:butyryl-CoA dehydrogenase
MAIYKAPLRDFKFVLQELFDLDQITSLPGYEEATADTFDAVLEQAGILCEEVLFPINRSGDEEGCTLENGVVRTPKGFPEAYKQFCDGGWSALSFPPEYGGQGLPHTLHFAVEEMICSANISFGMYPGLTGGAIGAIYMHADESLKSKYLPKMISGEWSGTMNLTEPHCGTDLGLIRTKALPNGDGTYAVTGTKIFISAGDQDLTDNVIHLVLAKLPDAPPGAGGISLLIVPKYLVDDETGVKTRNAVSVGSIEHKMGIRASATCVMNYDNATGWLVGAPHKGLRAMFTMMNAARLGVGIQGLGLAETANQSARAYANDRLAGRALTGTKYPDRPADPLTVHPDIRRMLLTIRSYVEGGRALSMWIATELDKAQKHPDPAVRQASDDLVALMTPIVKAFLTDLGMEACILGQQVFGGHGYIKEWGMEQLVRDARITPIYEGANGIQALDLVGRKLPQHMGRLLRRFFHPVSEYLQAAMEKPELAEIAMPVFKIFSRLQQITALLAQKGMANPDEAGAAAYDYLRLFGYVTLGYLWTRMAEAALPKVNGDDGDFYKGKVAVARFYVQRVLPVASAHAQAIMAGADTLMALEDELV